MLGQIRAADDLFVLSALGEIYVETAPCDGARRIDVARRKVRKSFRSEPPAIWARIEGVLTAASWRLSTTPLPHDSPAIGLQSLRDELSSLVLGLPAFGDLVPEVNASLDAMSALCEAGDNPLGELTLGILGTAVASRSAMAIAGRQSLASVEGWLRRTGLEIPVFARDRVATMPPLETLVIVGSPRWFNPALLTAPRAESTCFVQFEWLGVPRAVEGLLPGTSLGVTRAIRTTNVPAEETAEADQLSPDPEWGTISARAANQAAESRSPADALVEARLLILGGQWGVFVEEDDESELMVAVGSPGGAIWIGRRSPRTVLPGDFVVLRSEGSAPDYIRQLADERFGAARYRPYQRRWKEALRKATAEAGGVTAARRELKRLGARAANLRYWLRDASIRTRHPSDFLAICEFSGIAAEAGTIWAAMERIFGAHVEAGFFIRQRLEEAVEEVGFDEIERVGRSEFQIEGCGAMTIYRVDGRSPMTERIPEDRLKHPFPLEVGAWHG